MSSNEERVSVKIMTMAVCPLKTFCCLKLEDTNTSLFETARRHNVTQNTYLVYESLYTKIGISFF